MNTRTIAVVAEYLVSCRAGALSETTIVGYEWGLAYLPERLPATAQQLEHTLATIDLAPESKIDMWRIWRTFFRWANMRYGLVDPTDQVRKPRRQRKLRRIFTQGELQAVWAACRSLRDQALIALLIDTGIRLDELASLTWSDIQIGLLRVRGKTGEREVPFSRRTQEMLVGLGDLSGPWAGRKGRLTTSGVSQAIRRVLRSAGLKGPKLGAHTFRHTFATEYLRAGGNVFVLQRILGHSSVDVTGIYIHLVRDDLAVHHEELSPLRLVWKQDEPLEGVTK